MEVQIETKLPVIITKEGKYFIAYTPALDLSTQAKDLESVKKRFVEMVQIFLEELISNNTLDEVLTTMGWEKIRKEWKPPVVVEQQLEQIQVYA